MGSEINGEVEKCWKEFAGCVWDSISLGKMETIQALNITR